MSSLGLERDMTMSNEPRSRLFFALNCPPTLKKTISQWRKSLNVRAGRPVPVANFHLTLLFLGAVDKAQIAGICASASNISVPGRSLTVHLDKLETWRKSGALVLTPSDASPELMRLSYALEQAMLVFGHEKEHMEFRPHLTLSRDYRLPAPEACSQPEFILRADRFTLYESCKGQYQVLAEWPLTQPVTAG